MKILFLEDNADFAEAMVTVLESLEHSVDYTNSIPKAIDLFDTHSYDAVITDIHLKGPENDHVSGFELIRHIRHRAHSDIVIAMTTGLDLIDPELVSRRGVDIFHYKPIKIGFPKFIDEIVHLVARRRVEHSRRKRNR